MSITNKPYSECGNCFSNSPKDSPTSGAISHSQKLMQEKIKNPKTFEYDKKEAINVSLKKASIGAVGASVEIAENLNQIKSKPQTLGIYALKGTIKATIIAESIENPMESYIDKHYPREEGKRPIENNEND
jgi:hypothetical protein